MRALLLIGLLSSFLAASTKAQTADDVRFRTPVLVQTGPALAFNAGDPQVLVSDGNVTILAWLMGNDREVSVVRSDGRGLSWSNRVRLDSGPSNARKLWSKSVVVSDALVYAAWEDPRSGVPEVYFSRSRNGGKDWTDETRLDLGAPAGVQTPSGSESFALAAAGDDLYVLAKAADQLRLLVSHDRGKTFGSPRVIVNAPVAGSDIVVESGRVHIAWREAASFQDPAQTRVVRSLDGGTTFEPSIEVSDPQSRGGFSSLALAADGDRVVVVWFERATALTQTRINTSSSGGLSWQTTPARAGSDSYPPFPGLPPQVRASGPTGVALALPVLDVPNADPVTGFADAIGVFMHSNDGVVFSSETLLGLYQGDFEMAGSGREVAIVHLSPALEKSISFSTDDGGSFALTEVQSQPTLNNTAIAYNALYRNYVATVSDTLAGKLSATGFRPQTLAFDQSVAGVVSADLQRFEESPVAWVLFSTELGREVIPSLGRALGISLVTGLFEQTVGLARAGDLSAPLGVNGAGSIADLAPLLPQGIPLFAVAVGVDPIEMEVGDITDVVELEL